jgi:hypothetical protein
MKAGNRPTGTPRVPGFNRMSRFPLANVSFVPDLSGG